MHIYAYFILMKVSVTERGERRQHIFHPLIYSLNGHNGSGQVRLKSGVESYIPVSLVDPGTQVPGASSVLSQAC